MRFVWTAERTEILVQNRAALDGYEIAALIGNGCTAKNVWHRASYLTLASRANKARVVSTPKLRKPSKPRPSKTFKHPSKEVWITAATLEAQKRSLKPHEVMAGYPRTHAHVAARWAAWASLLETDRYSIAGVGKTSGFNHASVIWAMRRLKSGEVQRAYEVMVEEAV